MSFRVFRVVRGPRSFRVVRVLRGLRAASWAVVSLGMAMAQASAPPSHDTKQELWRSCAGFTDADMSRVAGGTVTARSLGSPEHRETAVAGAVRIYVPVDFFVTRFRDIAAFKRSDLVLQIGRFSSPPNLGDVGTLTFDPSDLDALRRCRVGNCSLKLPADAIERFRTTVNWSASDWREQATLLARKLLVEGATAYLERGDPAIGPISDRRKPVDAGAEFRGLLTNVGCDRGAAPGFFQYLADYPKNRPPDAENFLYWSKETFGMKPVVSLTHVVIHRPHAGTVLIATKGLLSNHYLDASLGLTLLLPAGSPESPAIDLVYVNRSRADALGGLFGGLTRAIVAGRQRDGTITELKALKTRLEATWRAAASGRQPDK